MKYYELNAIKEYGMRKVVEAHHLFVAHGNRRNNRFLRFFR